MKLKEFSGNTIGEATSDEIIMKQISEERMRKELSGETSRTKSFRETVRMESSHGITKVESIFSSNEQISAKSNIDPQLKLSSCTSTAHSDSSESRDRNKPVKPSIFSDISADRELTVELGSEEDVDLNLKNQLSDRQSSSNENKQNKFDCPSNQTTAYTRQENSEPIFNNIKNEDQTVISGIKIASQFKKHLNSRRWNPNAYSACSRRRKSQLFKI